MAREDFIKVRRSMRFLTTQHIFTTVFCCLMAFCYSAAAQTSMLAWQEIAQDQLIDRSDIVIVSWPNDILTISMGKTGEDFDPDKFATEVVCTVLLEAGKPEGAIVGVEIYLLKFDGSELQAELGAAKSCA